METKNAVLNHLLVVVFNQILSIEEKELKKGPFSNLTLNELHVIEAIGINKVQAMTSIALKRHITVGTLTITMTNLVKKGYVTRERSEADRRVVLISLTELGKKAFIHHESFHEAMVDNTMSSLDPHESDILIKALSKVTAYFNQMVIDQG